MRRPESAACTGPSGRAQKPSAGWQRSRRTSPGSLDCRPRPRLPRRRRRGTSRDFRAGGNDARCFRRRRWRRPPNADGENQREERHAIQRVAVEIENRKSQRQRDGNGQQHNARFAPAQSERDEQRHGNRRDEKVLREVRRIYPSPFRRNCASRDVQIVRKHVAAQLADFLQRALRDQRRIRALAFGERDGDRGIFRRWPRFPWFPSRRRTGRSCPVPPGRLPSRSTTSRR